MKPVAITSRFWRLAALNVVSNLTVPLAGLVDIAFLGHLSEVKHLAGVALAGVLFNYLYWSFGFLRMGTTGLVAQAAGRNDREAMALVALRHGLLALALGGLLLLLQWPLRELGFALLAATPEVEAAGRHFFDALIWGAPATLLNFVLIGWFLGRERGAAVLAMTATASFANVALDALLIGQWGWGSLGAGAATATSQYLALAVGLVAVGSELMKLPTGRRLFELAELGAIFALNRDILVRTFVLVSVLSLFTNLGATLGTTFLAANAVLQQVVSLGAYFIDGLAFATETLAGYCRGMGDTRQLRHLLRLAGGSSVLLGLAIAFVCMSLPDPIFAVLTSQPAVLATVKQHVFWLLPVLGAGSLAYMLDGYFLGLTEGRRLRSAMLVAAVAGFAPFAVLAWWQQSSHLLWLALASFMSARAVTLACNLASTLAPPVSLGSSAAR